MHHTAPWYLPWGLKLVPLPIPPGHPASGIPNPAGLHLLAPLPGIYAPEPRKVSLAVLVSPHPECDFPIPRNGRAASRAVVVSARNAWKSTALPETGKWLLWVEEGRETRHRDVCRYGRITRLVAKNRVKQAVEVGNCFRISGETPDFKMRYIMFLIPAAQSFNFTLVLEI